MGAVVVRCKEKGRAKQMNAGAQEAARRLGLHWHAGSIPATSETGGDGERLEFGWCADGTPAASETGDDVEGLGFGRCTDGVPDASNRTQNADAGRGKEVDGILTVCQSKTPRRNTDAGKREGAGWYSGGVPAQDSHGHTSSEAAQAKGVPHEGCAQAQGGGDVEEAYTEGWNGGLYSPHALGKGGLVARDSGLFCFLHADTIVPKDFVRTVSRHLAETRNCCIGFVTLIRGAREDLLVPDPG